MGSGQSVEGPQPSAPAPLSDVICEINYDFHGIEEENCVKFAEYSYKNHPEKVVGQRVLKINYNTGKPKPKTKSENIQKAVISKLKSLGAKVEVNEFNQGIVTVTL